MGRQLVGRDLLLGPSLDPSSPKLDFVKKSVHLWSFGLRSWLWKSHLSSEGFIKHNGTVTLYVRYEVAFCVGQLWRHISYN